MEEVLTTLNIFSDIYKVEMNEDSEHFIFIYLQK